MRDIYISPIKAVLHCTDDPALDFILCTSEDYLSKPLPSNVLRLDFRDTVDVDDPAAFSAQLAADVASFLQRPDARLEEPHRTLLCQHVQQGGYEYLVLLE